MLKRLIIVASVILVVCLGMGFPVCRGRFLSAKLVEAVEDKNNDLVENLLDKGANPNVKAKDGTPLLILAAVDSSQEIMQLLLAKGADINARLPDTVYPELTGKTALHFERDPEIVELLLDKGANINARDNSGQTPLYFAVSLGRVDIVKILLARGAKTETKDNRWGHTPLHEAVIMAETEIMEQLISHGANVDARDKNNCTPLHFAVLSRHCKEPDIEDQAHVYGIDVNNEHYRRAADFRLSNFEKCVKVVQLLLDNGADANAKNVHGITILHLASRKGHRCIVEMLLNYGADINAKDNEGKTPLDIAIEEGHSETAKLLAEHGAKTSAELNAAPQT